MCFLCCAGSHHYFPPPPSKAVCGTGLYPGWMGFIHRQASSQCHTPWLPYDWCSWLAITHWLMVGQSGGGCCQRFRASWTQRILIYMAAISTIFMCNGQKHTYTVAMTFTQRHIECFPISIFGFRGLFHLKCCYFCCLNVEDSTADMHRVSLLSLVCSSLGFAFACPVEIVPVRAGFLRHICRCRHLE